MSDGLAFCLAVQAIDGVSVTCEEPSPAQPIKAAQEGNLYRMGCKRLPAITWAPIRDLASGLGPETRLPSRTGSGSIFICISFSDSDWAARARARARKTKQARES